MCIFARKKGVMAQVSMTIRMDEGLEPASDETVRQRGIEAFNAIWAMAEAGELPDLTMDEINEEIRLYRVGK